MQITSILYLTLLAAVGIASAASLSPTDKQFMVSAAKTDMTEAHEGQMAENQGRSDDVKNLAKTLVRAITQFLYPTERTGSQGRRLHSQGY